jgi:hypothetical protein
MTHEDLARIERVLRVIEDMTMDQCADPNFVGTIRAKAFRACLPIKYELERHQVKIVQEVA